MKKLTSLIIIAVILFSCSKNSDSSNGSGQAEITYSFNGKDYAYTGEATGIGATGVYGWKTGTYYGAQGYKDATNNFNIVLTSTSISPTSYTGTTLTMSIEINGIVYTSFGASDNTALMISNYDNGVVSGTFSGKFTSDRNVPSPQYITLTNGVIKNVTIHVL